MRKFLSHTALLFLLLNTCLCVQAQLVFKTIVTQGPIVAGEPFQVQYVLENIDDEDEFFPPDFKDFRFVSGPNVYVGAAYGIDGPGKLKNIVYTLVALRPGKFLVPGAAARVGDDYIKSKNVPIEVISKAVYGNQNLQHGSTEVNEDYFLAPGEDPYEKMRRNLFMKVAVDKKSCYVGEPVTAVFKLYSRLESKSDIVKNPGFYGFTVQDMVSLNNRMMTTEMVNGKKFDVHIVRKVQLYPLQVGLFTIDPMEVQNKVEFSKSAVYKKTEQEIVEGVFSDDAPGVKENAIVYENGMSTEPIAINVKASPPKNKPLDYNGATGRFTMSSTVEKRELAKNEEAELLVTISGKGNFTQLSPPDVKWPAGVEGFEPVIKDFLSYEDSPMSGRREFHFRFVSSKPGHYELPAIGFSFFNPDSNSYKKLSSDPVVITVTNQEKKLVTEKNILSPEGTKSNFKIIGVIALLLAVICLVVFGVKKRQRNQQSAGVQQEIKAAPLTEWLQPAIILSEADDKTFYVSLRNCIWNFLGDQFNLTGSRANKTSLIHSMNESRIDPGEQKELLDILENCETGVFINADTSGMDKVNFLERTKQVVEKLSEGLQR